MLITEVMFVAVIGRITSADSIMWYANGLGTTNYQSPSFAPMLKTNFSSAAVAQAATSICGLNAACSFDYAATENIYLALSSLHLSTAYDLANTEFGTFFFIDNLQYFI